MTFNKQAVDSHILYNTKNKEDQNVDIGQEKAESEKL